MHMRAAICMTDMVGEKKKNAAARSAAAASLGGLPCRGRAGRRLGSYLPYRLLCCYLPYCWVVCGCRGCFLRAAAGRAVAGVVLAGCGILARGFGCFAGRLVRLILQLEVGWLLLLLPRLYKSCRVSGGFMPGLRQSRRRVRARRTPHSSQQE